MTNEQAAADFAAVYASRYPSKPAPVVRLYPASARFEIQEGWAKRSLSRPQLLAETAAMFVSAATGGAVL